MDLPREPVTLKELQGLIDSFINNCERVDGHFKCKKCGEHPKVGFAHLFLVEEGDTRSKCTIHTGSDGFGIEYRKVPYCGCNPPDGFQSTYTSKILIKPEPDEKSGGNGKKK